MKKNKNLKTRWAQKKVKHKEKNLNLAHPVVKASYIWTIISDQLLDVLGSTIHHQWFKETKPLVISDNVLILEVPNHFCAQWIHTHYHELVDALLSAMDKRLSSYFVSQSERLTPPKIVGLASSESTASEIKSQCED